MCKPPQQAKKGTTEKRAGNVLILLATLLNKNKSYMRDELISFETAKLAKEKGYNESSQWYFEIYRGKPNCLHTNSSVNNSRWIGDGFENLWVCCTQSLLQRWLRENHKVIVSVVPYTSTDGLSYDVSEDEPEESMWSYFIHVDRISVDNGVDFSSYEQALDAGLQEALRNFNPLSGNSK